MNYPDDWGQFSDEFDDFQIMALAIFQSPHLFDLSFDKIAEADFENALLMGGEIAR